MLMLWEFIVHFGQKCVVCCCPPSCKPQLSWTSNPWPSPLASTYPSSVLGPSRTRYLRRDGFVFAACEAQTQIRTHPISHQNHEILTVDIRMGPLSNFWESDSVCDPVG